MPASESPEAPEKGAEAKRAPEAGRRPGEKKRLAGLPARRKVAAYRKRVMAMCALSAILIAAAIWSMVAGEYEIKALDIFGYVWKLLAGGEADEAAMPKVHQIIVGRLRLPRTLLAISAGISLSVAGAAYQGCFRNPLVDPYILGVSSGAAAGAALSIVFPEIFPFGQLAAFALALAAVMISYALATVRGQTPAIALVLSGVIIGALFSSLVGVMKYVAADSELREITFWMMGGLYYASWADARLNLAIGLPALAFLALCGWRLNLLTLGDEEAKSLGVNPKAIRGAAVLVATLAAAFCVSTCGIIAWVGLMVPHAARLLVGPDHRWLIPASALLGAIYLLACDTIARTLTAAEIPLGIVTSVVGAPYLIWLLRSRGSAVYGH